MYSIIFFKFKINNDNDDSLLKLLIKITRITWIIRY